MIVRLVLLVALGLGILAGCGQKGPLYRPDEGPKAASDLVAERPSAATSDAAATYD